MLITAQNDILIVFFWFRYRVLKTQRLLDERRQEEVVAEERAVQRQVRDRQASQQVTRHYREKEKQRRRKCVHFVGVVCCISCLDATCGSRTLVSCLV